MNNLKSKVAGYAIWVLIVLLGVSLVKSIGRASRIKSQIESEKEKIVKIQAENAKLEEKLAQAQSADFIEKEVRNKLGLGKTGEAMVVLPDEEVLKKLAPIIPEEVSALPDPNWRKWAKLFH